MKSTSVFPAEVLRFENGRQSSEPDLLAVEEPMEIQVWYGPADRRRKTSLAVTMRTPGHDFELASGFLYSEGIIQGAHEIEDIRYCLDVKSEEEVDNVVVVRLTSENAFDPEALQRHFYATSSCGVCGKASIEALEMTGCPLLPQGRPRLSPELLTGLDQAILGQQMLFKHTGGIHAAALFDREGKVRMIREDIGRHNAVDKLVGASLHAGELPLSESILWISGRAGFEIVQKAILAGIPVLAAVGAPSSLAVRTAQEYGLTLIGFLRNQRFNVYSGKERLAAE